MVERIARAWFWLAAALGVTLLVAGAIAGARPALAWAKAEIHEVDLLRGEVRSLVVDIHESVDDNYYDIKATVGTFAVMARDSDDFIEDLHAGITGGRDSHGVQRAGILPALEGLISQFRDTAAGLSKNLDAITKDVGGVTGAAKDTLAPLKATLENVARLTDRLDGELAKGSPKFLATVDELNQALADLDKLLADPNIAATIAHVEGTAESIDGALRPWRKRAGLLKTILGRLIGLVQFRFSVPVP